MLVIMGTISLIPFTFFMSLVRLAFLVFLFLPEVLASKSTPTNLSFLPSCAVWHSCFVGCRADIAPERAPPGDIEGQNIMTKPRTTEHWVAQGTQTRYLIPQTI